MSKKIFALLFAVIMVASLFAGCAGSSESAGDAAEQSSQTASQPEPSGAEAETGAEDVSLTVLCGFASEDPHGQYIYQYAEAFSAQNLNVKVEVQAISTNDIYTRLAAMATTPDDIPTLFYTSGDSIAMLHDLGLTQDMNGYFSDDVKNGLANGALEACTINSEMAFYPVAVQPQAIIYRKDRFEAAGLGIPGTWDEFVECAKTLTTLEGGEEQWGFSMVGSNNSSGQSRFMSYLWSNGFKLVYQEDGVWKSDITADAEFMTAFSRWTDMNNTHKVVPTGITEVDYATSANYFAMGYTNLFLTGSNALGVSYASNPDLKGKLASFKMPGDHPGTMLNAEGYAVSAHASEAQKKAAAEFLTFFTSNDADMMFWHSSGKIPSTVEGQKVEYITGEDYKGYIDQINAGCLPVSTFPGLNGLKSALGNAYSAVFSGEMSNQQAVEKLILDVEELLQDYN